MKKFFACMLISALTITISYAQTSKKKGNWGIKSGLNISNLRTDGNSDYDWKTGLVFGAYFKMPAGNNFAIQPEFLYSSLGGHFQTLNGAKNKYRLNYFSIPVLANINVAKKLSVVAGPEVDFLIQGKTVTNGGSTKSTGDFKDISFGLTGGFEAWPFNCLGLSARYHHGFSNVVDDESSSFSKTDLKNQAIQLTVAVRL